MYTLDSFKSILYQELDRLESNGLLFSPNGTLTPAFDLDSDPELALEQLKLYAQLCVLRAVQKNIDLITQL